MKALSIKQLLIVNPSDNGLFGGFVNGDAFNATFNKPSPTIVGLIVAIYEGRYWSNIALTSTSQQGQWAVSSDQSFRLFSANTLAERRALVEVSLS